MSERNREMELASRFEQCGQILKNAGILKVRKEGTMNFYYFDSEMKSLEELVETLQLAIDIAKGLPEKRAGMRQLQEKQE